MTWQSRIRPGRAPVLRVWSDEILVRGPEEMLALVDRGGRRPVIEPAAGVTVPSAWVQPLERTDHAEIVRGWNESTLAEGKDDLLEPVRRLPRHQGTTGLAADGAAVSRWTFKNGSDPLSMYLTLDQGLRPDGAATAIHHAAKIQCHSLHPRNISAAAQPLAIRPR